MVYDYEPIQSLYAYTVDPSWIFDGIDFRQRCSARCSHRRNCFGWRGHKLGHLFQHDCRRCDTPDKRMLDISVQEVIDRGRI